MGTARWSSGLFLTLVVALSGAFLFTSGQSGSQDPAKPDRGSLPPVLDPLPTPIPVARVDADLGRIVDLDVVGETLAILAREGWVLFGYGPPVLWSRDRNVGSPDWLSRPVSIAVGSEAIFVLDAGRSLVSVWNRGGTRLPDLPVSRGKSLNHRPAKVLLGPLGQPLVTAQKIDEGGAASWDLVGLQANGQPLEIISLSNTSRHMVFEEPLLAFGDSTLFGISPLTHRLSRFDLTGGGSTLVATRVDPPLWRVPKHHRREYEKMLASLGGEASQRSQLPEFWPSVRDFTVQEAGCVLLAITAGEDRQQIEILTDHLVPLGRFSPDGFDQPVFLSQGRAFRAEEGLDETVIYELETEVCRSQ